MLYEKRTDYPQLITPKGVAVWPSLNTPDFKFKKEFGAYSTKLRISPDAPGLDKLREAAEKLRDEAFEAKKKELKEGKKGALLKMLDKVDPVIAPEIDKETGEETGFLIINASMNAGGRRRKDDSLWSQKPDYFNAKGKALKNPPKIGGGSELKLGVRLRDWFVSNRNEALVGVAFDLEAVQIITLKEWGGERSADDYGFSEEEGDEVNDRDPGFGEEDGDDIQDGEDDGVPGDF